MNIHHRRMLDLVSENILFTQVKEMLEDVLSGNFSDETIFTMYLTAGQFRALHGFYASEIIMEELVSPYIGRLLRFYVLQNPAAMRYVMQVMKDSDKAQSKAAIRLSVYFTQKYGPVSQERTKELDEIGNSWRLQSNLELDRIQQGGSFDDVQSN